VTDNGKVPEKLLSHVLNVQKKITFANIFQGILKILSKITLAKDF